MNFNNPTIRIFETDKDKLWQLTEDLVFSLPMGNGGRISVRVPDGFLTDLASVPWWVTWLYPTRGYWLLAAILHDFLYSSKGECSRFLADSLLREGLRDIGMAWYRRVPVYYGVRTFGWMFWGSETRIESVRKVEVIEKSVQKDNVVEAPASEIIKHTDTIKTDDPYLTPDER